MNDWDDTTNVAVDLATMEAQTPPRNLAYLIVIAGTNVGEMHKIEDNTTVLGRSVESGIRLIDDGISRQHCRIQFIGGVLTVRDLDSRNGTFCNGKRLKQRELKDGDKLQLGKTTILKFTYQDHLEESFQKQMLESAMRDGLTGAYNKRYFMDRLDSEIKFALRHKVNLALMFFDLDKFKAVNDIYGHLAGDKVLKVFAESVQKSIRNEDVFARYGGEEFAILARSISRQDVFHFADRLREDTANLVIESDGVHIPITVSIGIAALPEDPIKTPDDLIKAADKMLYEAKRLGRNRVVMTTPDS